MARITFIEHSGERTVVEAEPGLSLMKAATAASVPGIAADCGGNAACGTCRIYVDAEWANRLPPVGDSEREMLDYTDDATPGVRLSCQIRVSEALDGMAVHLPASQHG